MALVDDDEVEEVSRDGLEDFVLFIGASESLVETKVNLVGGIDFAVLDFGHDRAEGLEVINEGLVGEDVTIYEEENALGFLCLPEPPDDLEGGVGLAGAGGHDEEKSFLLLGNGFEGAVDCLRLVVAWFFAVGVFVVRLGDECFYLIFDAS